MLVRWRAHAARGRDRELETSSSSSRDSSSPEAWPRPAQKRNVGRKSELQASHRWRVGQYIKPPRQIGNGASDPFSATPVPMDQFYHDLLPVLQRSHLLANLSRVTADIPDPILQWAIGLSKSRGTAHGAYLLGHSIARRLPTGPTLPQSQVRAHLGSALASLRDGLQQSALTQSLAQLNIMLAAYSFFCGSMNEWLIHAKASKEIIVKMGGMSHVDAPLRGMILVSTPIVCGATLVPPMFHASDFEMLASEDDPLLAEYNFGNLSVPVDHPALRKLFRAHKQFHTVHEQHRAKWGFSEQNQRTQLWLDNRFHILNLLSLETYFEVHRLPIDISEEQRVDIHLNGILTLALTDCHQFIYHHTRTSSGLLGDQVTVPLFTIPFHHLRSHLQRLLDFENYDLMNDYRPLLWALFVLACHEQVAMKATMPDSSVPTWAESLFRDVQHRLPEELHNVARMRHLLKQYLYDDSLDPFLMRICCSEQYSTPIRIKAGVDNT